MSVSASVSVSRVCLPGLPAVSERNVRVLASDRTNDTGSLLRGFPTKHNVLLLIGHDGASLNQFLIALTSFD